MTSLADPLHLTAVFAAVLWPLALGVSLVLWTKLRAADRRRRLSAIDGGLQGLFEVVAAQPLPERLELVVDTLAEQMVAEKPGEAILPAGRETAPTV